ncbi:MAG TPA: hypothetical protein VG710_02900 [Opitutus sp.]|nr:hypothetical protein [Opitutus sp.]
MKTPFPFLVLLLVSLGLAGCDTFEHRAQQKAGTFAALTPAQRDKLKQGVIELGDTPDMVYIALGTPDEKRERSTPAGTETDWIYNTYHEEFAGNVTAGYHRVLVYDPARKRFVVFLDPIHTAVYQQTEEENIRATFRGGRLVAIEQPKRP